MTLVRSHYAGRFDTGFSDAQREARAKSRLLEQNRAAGERRAREFAESEGKTLRKFPSLALIREHDSPEARARSKYIDRRIREAVGLGVAAPAEQPNGKPPHGKGGAGWNARLTTKRKYEPKHLGGKPTP